MLKLGKLIPADEAVAPELLGWLLDVLLELDELLDEEELEVIDPRSLSELWEPLGGLDIELELADEFDEEAFDVGLNGEADAEL